MNISQTMIQTMIRGSRYCGTAVLALGAMAAAGHTATLPAVVSAPVGAGIQSVGGAVNAVGRGHAGIAPTVYTAAPNLEPVADGVTNGLLTVGGGITTSGQRIQSGGLGLNPLAGARTGLQAVGSGSLVKVRVGSLAIGRGSPTTIIGVGALTKAAPRGTLATAGVANANALLNANLAPQ